MKFNARFWSEYFRSQYVPQVRLLVDALTNRLLPTLKDTDIEHEAEAVQDEFWERLGSMPADEAGHPDLADAAEDAHEAGLRHYLTLKGIRQGLINMFAVALYHVFEQQLLEFHRREVLRPGENQNPSLYNVSVLRARLEQEGIELKQLPSWRKLDELRLVANAIKHAEGDSADRLRAVRPDLFRPPFLPPEFLVANPTVFLPLAGEDLYVREEDVFSFQQAIEGFWEELVESLTRGHPA